MRNGRRGGWWWAHGGRQVRHNAGYHLLTEVCLCWHTIQAQIDRHIHMGGAFLHQRRQVCLQIAQQATLANAGFSHERGAEHPAQAGTQLLDI